MASTGSGGRINSVSVTMRIVEAIREAERGRA
jgi:hypothetical protein